MAILYVEYLSYLSPSIKGGFQVITIFISVARAKKSMCPEHIFEQYLKCGLKWQRQNLFLLLSCHVSAFYFLPCEGRVAYYRQQFSTAVAIAKDELKTQLLMYVCCSFNVQ